MKAILCIIWSLSIIWASCFLYNYYELEGTWQAFPFIITSIVIGLAGLKVDFKK